MSIQYCHKCGKNIDTDFNVEHFDFCKVMKINIVTEPAPGWILRNWSICYANELRKLGHEVLVNTQPLNNTEINLYINYALLREKCGNCLDIAVFTHREDDPKLAEIFDHAADIADRCLAMSEYTKNLLPIQTTDRIFIPPHNQFLKKKPLRIGVVGRTYGTGRKNEDWLPVLREIGGIEIVTTYDKQIPFDQMPAFYADIDYLLIIANKEGGPMPVLEALAMHKPVIAPNVGLSWEFPVIKYKTLDDLKCLLRSLVLPANAWEIAGKQLESILLTLMSN